MTRDQDESRDLRDRAFGHWQSLMTNWRRRALRNRAMSKLLGYGSVLLSIVTAALSGIPGVPRWWIVIASAGAALAVGLRHATKSHDQWTLAREMQNRLYAERFLFEQGAGAYHGIDGDERTRLFSVRITDIGMTGHNSWAGHVSDAAAAITAVERS